MPRTVLSETPAPVRRKNVAIGVVAALGLLVCVIAANFVTTRYGLVPVGFGLMATAGTYLAGLTFVLRDLLQDALGSKWVLGLIAVGAALSFLLADPFIATASAVAFLLAEVTDFAVYTPLRKRGYIRAAIASNAVGAFIDTVAFLSIAGFAIQEALPGQMVGKLAMTALAVIFVVGIRAWRKVGIR